MAECVCAGKLRGSAPEFHASNCPVWLEWVDQRIAELETALGDLAAEGWRLTEVLSTVDVDILEPLLERADELLKQGGTA